MYQWEESSQNETLTRVGGGQETVTTYSYSTTWTDSTGAAYSRVQTGLHSKEAMIAQAEQEVKILTWILRLVGWIVMSSGLGMFLSPLRVISDIIPFCGRIVGAGLGLISGLVAAVVSLVTIAIAWIAVRPMIGIPILILAVVILVLVFKKTKKAPVAAPAPA